MGKKKLLAGLIMGLALLMCCGWSNWQIVDTTWNYDYAILELPDGRIIEGDVETWKDYENSDSVQVKIDGITYYTHLENVVLMHGVK